MLYAIQKRLTCNYFIKNNSCLERENDRMKISMDFEVRFTWVQFMALLNIQCQVQII